MKPLWCAVLAFIVLSCLALGSRAYAQVAASASPSTPTSTPSTQEPFDILRIAAANLNAAGNYTWARRDERDIQGKTRRMPPRAEGETEIGGFSTVVAPRRKMVFFRDETAYLLQAGWRHGVELTEADFDELQLLGMSRAYKERWRHPTQALPHDVLALVLNAAINVRKEGPVIVGDIDRWVLSITDLEGYLLHGQMRKPDMVSSVRNVLNPTLPAVKRLAERGGATFSVWLASDQIEELLVVVSYGGSSTQGNSYRFEKIGTTRVIVEPEARALFLSAPPAR